MVQPLFLRGPPHPLRVPSVRRRDRLGVGRGRRGGRARGGAGGGGGHGGRLGGQAGGLFRHLWRKFGWIFDGDLLVIKGLRMIKKG